MLDPGVLIAVPIAVAGAACMGLASAAQAGSAKQVEAGQTLDPRLFMRLIRQPLWLLGVACTIAGLVLQLLALNFGPLILVQPILITSLLFACTFYAWLGHSRVDIVILLGALLCCGGLAAFLLLAQPTAGRAEATSDWGPIPLTIVLFILLAAGALTANRLKHHSKVLLLALCTGLAYGMTAALMKVLTSQRSSSGFAALFAHPVLYMACILGPVGFLLSQNTFQVGRWLSPALAVIQTTDPIVGVLLGMTWFDERVTVTPVTVTGEAIAGAAVICGIVVLSHRADYLQAGKESSTPETAAPESSGEQAGPARPRGRDSGGSQSSDASRSR